MANDPMNTEERISAGLVRPEEQKTEQRLRFAGFGGDEWMLHPAVRRASQPARPSTGESSAPLLGLLPTSDELIAAIGGPSDISTREYLNTVRGSEGTNDALRETLTMTNDAIQNDIAALLRALGLPDCARDASPHEVMVDVVIPMILRDLCNAVFRIGLDRRVDDVRRHAEQIIAKMDAEPSEKKETARDEAHAALDALIAAERGQPDLERPDAPVGEIYSGNIMWRASTVTLLRAVMQAVDAAATEDR